MRKIVLLLLAVALSNGAYAKHPRDKGPKLTRMTDKSVAVVSSCVSRAMDVGGSVVVSSVPLEHGISIVQSANVFPIGLKPFIIVDVTADGERTTVAVMSTGGTPKNPEKSFKEIVGCL